MNSDERLCAGWEWRGIGKVKKGRKHYIRVDGTNFKYVNAGISRGDWTILCEGGCPYLKIAALTHYEDELEDVVRQKELDNRDALNSI